MRPTTLTRPGRWPRRSRRHRTAVLLGALAALLLATAGQTPAAAHEMTAGAAVTVTQTLGSREITLVMSPPTAGPAAMPVLASVQGPALESPISLQSIPAGTAEPVGRVDLQPRPGAALASGNLQVDRTGQWEVVLTVGPDVARVPLAVPEVVATPAWAWAIRAGLVVAVLCAIGATAMWRRRRKLALGLGGGGLVAATVAATAALLSIGIPATTTTTAPADLSAAGIAGTSMPGMDMPGSMPGTSMSDSMPGMNMPTTMTAGAEVTGAVVVTVLVSPAGSDGLTPLSLQLTDGSTGAPVDDTVIHDEALMHLVVVGPDQRLFHVHPARVGPGRYVVRLPLSEPGRYGVFAETVRAGGGHQVSRCAFTLPTGVAQSPAQREVIAPTGGAEPRDVAGVHVDLAVGSPVVGHNTRVALTFSDANGPVRDLQGWLGMAGHLLVLGPEAVGSGPAALDPGTSFAHVHDMDPPVRNGFGPTIAFTYAFPAAGRYQLWAQVQHDWQLVTIPFTVDVAPASS